MPFRVKPTEVFTRGYTKVLTGGIERFETTELSDDEVTAIEDFLDETSMILEQYSTKLASDFRNERENILDMCAHFKAKCDNKEFNTKHIQMPDSGQLGMNFLIPQFLGENKIERTVTAGTEAYLLGSATTWFKTSSTPEQRYMVYIIKNGIIHIGQTPITRQFKIDSEKTTYTPFTTYVLEDIPLERDTALYRYHTVASLFLNWDVGYRVAFMPIRDGTVEFHLIGVVVYERDAFASLKWI